VAPRMYKHKNYLFVRRRARQGENQEGKTKRGREVKSRRNKNNNIKSKTKKRHVMNQARLSKKT